jgi:hypothetical protein
MADEPENGGRIFTRVSDPSQEFVKVATMMASIAEHLSANAYMAMNEAAKNGRLAQELINRSNELFANAAPSVVGGFVRRDAGQHEREQAQRLQGEIAKQVNHVSQATREVNIAMANAHLALQSLLAWQQAKPGIEARLADYDERPGAFDFDVEREARNIIERPGWPLGDDDDDEGEPS